MPKKKPDMSFGWFSGPPKDGPVPLCPSCGDIGYTAIPVRYPNGFIDYATIPCDCPEGEVYKDPKPPASGGTPPQAS